MIHQDIDKKTALGLKVLRKRIEASKVPSSRLDEQILIASWNIREFGRRGRTEKAIHYIAEILSYFDLIALQELCADMSDLARVMNILGPYWKVVFSDATEGRRGNEERIAYLYDKRAVAFTGLAAEAVAPPVVQRINGKRQVLPSEQFWRTPYIASFRTGTFDLVLISVHVQWGTLASREEELGQIADWVEKRRQSKFVEDKDIILMGDFNIPKKGDRFYQAITRHKLAAPGVLLGNPGSNLTRDAVYDQIFYYPQHTGSVFTNQGGVVDFYAGNHRALFAGMSKEDFTYQLSDHLPLWLVVNIDTVEEELDRILNPKDY